MVEAFFEENGIKHAERVELTQKGYTVWSYRRDADGNYVLAPRRQDPIMDVHYFDYEDA
jgi:predicted GNAT superfamily acetyltransferase